MSGCAGFFSTIISLPFSLITQYSAANEAELKENITRQAMKSVAIFMVFSFQF
jgi:hypothetical protein